ncbi:MULTISPECIES: hypothetical protein [unclassified Lysobacter]|uniref:hypothetical protein n=1 Tax=unclassified Lysobacter TaxID=2635362 RepID=UPI001BE90491|nr:MULTISPECIES: hypothetical protein [unclassified Lysobacter]MBT2746184.1 hypothetical protein [Lysobacter sp. ISL-42]MBT2750729.1 hypothetical protein [Lysobacter sp. ISL-50]MBT2776124.1 hypothetical protein [Lysobacter sp. ISL-54]MBT2784630.1 hypothetical protein [Lysobacter sp. ISL-52]
MTSTILPPYQLHVRFSRKPENSRAMRRELSGYPVEPELVWVIERKTMTQTEYRAFERDFFKPQYWIVPLNSRPGHCIMVVAPRLPALYVRAEGYNYARYVGLAVA